MTCEEAPEASLWIVGVLMSIAASTCTNLGVNMQKYSFICEAKKKVTDKRPYLSQPLYISVFGSLGDFAALGFAPQTLVTPVGGFTMVANVVFAHFFLKEAFVRRDALATLLIIIGVIMVAAFADKGAKCYTLDELIDLYKQASFMIYVALVVIGCTGLYIAVRRIEALRAKSGSSSVAYKRYEKIHPILYPALSGVLGAQSVLFAKSTAELFKMTFEGNNQFTQFGTYMIGCGMFTCIFLQIHWLAKGLQTFDAVFIVPVFQCFFISTSIVGGGVYFDEFATMKTTPIVMFFCGVALTLFGVYLLSMRDMVAVRPIGKFRAGAHSIVFIKRTQKTLGLEYKWRFTKKLAQDDATKQYVLPTKKPGSAVVLPAAVLVSHPAPIEIVPETTSLASFTRPRVLSREPLLQDQEDE